MKRLVLSLGLSLASVNWAAAAGAVVQAEINYLLDHLEKSGCTFYRNGSWYSATDARAHLEKKYAYLRERALVNNAEDFIELAASKSSMSDDPYRIKCSDNPPMLSNHWLAEALRRYRQQGK